MQHPHWHERAWIRLALFVLVAWSCPPGNNRVRGLAGWVCASTVALVYQCWQIARSTPETTRHRASVEDPGRTVVWLIILAACLFSLVASLVLMGAKESILSRTVLMVGCLWSVLSAWFLTHTAFTLRYAHLYYREGEGKEGGLEFPGDHPPDDWDFAFTPGGHVLSDF